MLWGTARTLVSCFGALAMLAACSDSGDDGGDAGDGGPPEAGVDAGAVLASGGSGASGGSERDASQGGAGSGSGGRGGDGGMSVGDATAGDVGAGGTGGAAQASDAGDAGGAGGTSGTGGVSDAGSVPETVSRHVHIYISNTCDVSVDPVEVTIPREQSVLFTYHNHSVDYEADVWMSYGGGYLGLVPGGTWADPIERCTELFTYTAHADVSIRGLGLNDPYCPGQRMTIHCE